ncbi:MAG: nicotinate-nucleotide adenylyltransferase [Nitrospirota bacterium]|jgi:nicotinate-nucleotide adenylyltransferase
MRLGFFGGTFNPIHFGHLRAAEEARERVGLDKVVFIPAKSPPLKAEDVASAEHRLRMTSIAVAPNFFFEVSDMECRRPEKSYTVETARELRDEYPGSDLFFIVGADAFLEIPLWREPDELVRLIDFVVIGRPTARFAELAESPYVEAGGDELSSLDSGERETLEVGLRGGRLAVLLGAPFLDISSTGIRRNIREGRSIKYLLPGRVESFIMTNGLYKGKP